MLDVLSLNLFLVLNIFFILTIIKYPDLRLVRKYCFFCSPTSGDTFSSSAIDTIHRLTHFSVSASGGQGPAHQALICYGHVIPLRISVEHCKKIDPAKSLKV
jgi:hypothetical protein